MNNNKYVLDRVNAILPAMFTYLRGEKHSNLSTFDLCVLESYVSGASIEELSSKYYIPQNEVQKKLKEIRDILNGDIKTTPASSISPASTSKEVTQPTVIYANAIVEIKEIFDSEHTRHKRGKITIESDVLKDCPTKFQFTEHDLIKYNINADCRCGVKICKASDKWRITNITYVQLLNNKKSITDNEIPAFYKPSKKTKRVTYHTNYHIDNGTGPTYSNHGLNPNKFKHKVNLVNNTGVDLNSGKKALINGRVVDLDDNWRDNN